MALALGFAGGVAWGAEPKLSAADAAVVRAVDAHYNHLRSLRTEFSETYEGMGLHRTEAGTLLLSKPGRMRWSYTEPAGKVFVMDGKFAWSYAPGDAQAQRISAKQMDDLRSPLRLLLGHTELERELTGITVAAEAGGSVIRGVPRGQEVRLKQLVVHVTAAGQIQSLRLEEVDGAATEFRFRGIEENVPVAARDFVFTPLAGVPVVDGMAPI